MNARNDSNPKCIFSLWDRVAFNAHSVGRRISYLFDLAPVLRDRTGSTHPFVKHNLKRLRTPAGSRSPLHHSTHLFNRLHAFISCHTISSLMQMNKREAEKRLLKVSHWKLPERTDSGLSCPILWETTERDRPSTSGPSETCHCLQQHSSAHYITLLSPQWDGT